VRCWRVVRAASLSLEVTNMQVGRVVGGGLCCLSGVGWTHDDALCQPLEACCMVVAPVAGGM
jgi:hypothetical protein